LLVLIVLLARGERGMEIEVLVPRHELSILRRQVGQPRFEPHDRLVNVDEVYRTFTDPSFGWPWAWVRVIDVASHEEAATSRNSFARKSYRQVLRTPRARRT
jgi:hypothetical protein